MAVRLVGSARDQRKALLRHSAREHGRDAAERYALLITATLNALASEPPPPGSRAIEGLPGLRTYSLALGRRRVPPGERVATPRHVVVYRIADDGAAEIIAFVHAAWCWTRRHGAP